MNIIQAIQAAEQGKLIRNGMMKRIDRLLLYMRNGIFYEYQLLPDGHTVYKYEVREFSMSDILSNDWEVVETKINPYPDPKIPSIA